MPDPDGDAVLRLLVEQVPDSEPICPQCTYFTALHDCISKYMNKQTPI
jgi:hypothetical protein